MVVESANPLRPVYLVSTGRSGTTLLARSLGGHPQVICRDVFPFENRSSQHLFVWAENGKENDFKSDAFDCKNNTRFRLFQRDDKLTKDWFTSIERRIRGQRVLEISDEYYRYIANIQKKEKVTSYLEKSIGFATVSRMHRWGWPLKIVLLLRDPRDILLSVKSFNKKNGVQGFGADKFDDEQLLHRYIGFFSNTISALEKNSIDYVLVQYEDLLMDPRQELMRIAESLNLNTDNESLEQMISSYATNDSNVTNHRTGKGKSLKAGGFRWTQELDREQLKKMSLYNEEIEKLGYEAC